MPRGSVSASTREYTVVLVPNRRDAPNEARRRSQPHRTRHPVPPRRVTQTQLFWFSLLCGPFLGSMLAIAMILGLAKLGTANLALLVALVALLLVWKVIGKL
jgi:hypothetical protein